MQLVTIPETIKGFTGGLKEAKIQLFERVITQLEIDRDAYMDDACNRWKLYKEQKNAKTNP